MSYSRTKKIVLFYVVMVKPAPVPTKPFAIPDVAFEQKTRKEREKILGLRLC